jgi:two-component system, LytTR family, sensor kinase
MKLNQAIFLKRARLIVAAWAGASLFFTAVLMVSDLGRKPLGFALYTNAVQFALWTMLLPVLSWCASLLSTGGSKKGRNGLISLLVVAVLGGFVAVAHWSIVYCTYFPYRSDYPSLRSLLDSELVRFMPMHVLIGIAIVIALAGWRAREAFQDERTRANALERQLAVARLEALRMQLHPHFLFNTLHTITGLTVEDPPLARRMVIALGDLLRSTLKDSGQGVRTLAEELEYSDLYLGIEKLRLGERLALNYDIESTATRALVPQFLLQPLFENAIRHGASRITSRCEVRFCASCRAGTLDIIIRNDGPRREPSTTPPRLGVGLTTTTDRLRMYYGDRQTFRYLDRPEGGAQVEISIPYADAANGLTAIAQSTKRGVAVEHSEGAGGETAPTRYGT